ncbi:orotidine-5'-phosphate decarboxylase [Desulfovibrio ferrophilus]|uniref:Orotidine 5'-phosphate decarboxylase n=1 Tax=Desulfovibrio ferrophilus TaxID=241368 RepID=A0A2Z6AV81_9BACT|nr:orotidine-5'-phosphate decarboxylase [Desulfovibrio ferrophilus]BBD07152.1 orotidine 5'-phosphate decarboxylase [Desulfovibrio ferrophilus]
MAELVVALDFPDKAQAMEMARTLAGTVTWVKVGLELYTAQGPSILAELKDMGFKVFVDLKFLDIPNTVRGAVRSAVSAGADMVNIHITGGERMMIAARQGLDEAASPGNKPLLLGVTVLTSMDENDLPLAPGQSIADLVLSLAKAGSETGLDGVVCSGHEATAVKKTCGNNFLCLTPGIRLAEADDDQRRVMTPAQAVAAGADFLVAGRPVTLASDPKQAALSFLEQMCSSTL